LLIIVFNKSHAACYGLIAYWTAYLKAHYPEAFMAALMTSDHGDIDRLAIEINECKRMGIKVLPPDVNEGFVEFAVVPDKKEIRFGMAAVKGVGVNAVEEILRAREDGKFSSIEDFAKRVSPSKFNRKAWESLIKSGGFDSLGDRSDILFNLDNIQAFATKLQKEASNGQIDLFGSLGDDKTIHPQVKLQPSPIRHSDKDRLMWERELLGLYISAHPLDGFDIYLKEQTISIAELSEAMEGQAVSIGGIISRIRTIVTKSNSKMAFIGVEDKTGDAEVIIFPNLYDNYKDKLLQDAVVRVTGKISCRNRDGSITSDLKIIADEIQFITDQELKDYKSTGNVMKIQTNKTKLDIIKPKTKTNQPGPKVIVEHAHKKLYVHIQNPDDHDSLMKLKQTCDDYPGLSDIILVLGVENKSAIKLNFKVDAGDILTKN